MLPKPIAEPQWNFTAREGPREHGRLSRPANARRRIVRFVISLAILTPVALLVALGVLLSRPYWQSEALSPEAARAAAEAELARIAASRLPPGPQTVGLGQRVAADREMCYKAEGWAFLGQYSIQIYDAASQSTLRADFALDGSTTCADALAFQRWATTHHCLFREQVMVAVRNSQLADLLEPDLTRLSVTLVTQVNRVLDEPFLKSVRLKGFCLYQSADNSDFVLWEDRNKVPPEEETSDEQNHGN